MESIREELALMLETIIRLACLVFGGSIILVTVLLCFYLMSNNITEGNTPILEIFLGGLAMGGGFIVFGIRSESSD